MDASHLLRCPTGGSAPQNEIREVEYELLQTGGKGICLALVGLIRAEFRYDGGGLGKGETVTLFVNGKQVAKGRLNETIWVGKYSADETFEVGQDSGSSASEAYASPFPYTGTIAKVVLDTQPANLTAADWERLRAASRRFEQATE